MNTKRTLGRVLGTLLLVAVVALLVGSLLGQPVLLGYVETGSMEPTLSPGDGFLAVPAPLAGRLEAGDVVVFRPERLNGGQLTTHRLVSETDAGYVTRGDANPFTDQTAGEPPIDRSQIVAEVVQVQGTVVPVPHLGTLVATAGTVSRVPDRLAGRLGLSLGGHGGLLVLFVLVVGAGHLWDRLEASGVPTRDRVHERGRGVDLRWVAVAVAGLVVLGATAAMVVPAGATEYSFVSSSHDVPGSGVIGVGQTETSTYRLENPGVLPVVSLLHTDDEGVVLGEHRVTLAPRSAVDVPVTLTAPDRTGYYRRFVVEHRYLAVLPVPVLTALHEVHPWLAVLAVDLVLGVPFAVVGALLVGRERYRVRRRRAVERSWLTGTVRGPSRRGER